MRDLSATPDWASALDPKRPSEPDRVLARTSPYPCLSGQGSQILKVSKNAARGFAGFATLALHHSFTGVRMGAALPFSSTTTNLAGSVLLALRPTTWISVGPS